MRWLKTLLRDETGQDMVEYALLCALISIVAIASLKTIGPIMSTYYNLKYTIARGG